MWNSGKVSGDDKAALLKHYHRFHKKNNNTAQPQFHEVWDVTFLEDPDNLSAVEMREDFWKDKLQASINIQKLVLPEFR